MWSRPSTKNTRVIVDNNSRTKKGGGDNLLQPQPERFSGSAGSYREAGDVTEGGKRRSSLYAGDSAPSVGDGRGKGGKTRRPIVDSRKEIY